MNQLSTSPAVTRGKSHTRSSSSPDLLGDDEAEQLASRWDEAEPAEVLAWALDRWQQRLGLMVAFQIEGMALIDMAWRIDPKIRVLTLDTGRLPAETHDLIERVRQRYGIVVETYLPEATEVEKMVNSAGPNLFYRSLEERKLCCNIRKVRPLGRALGSVEAWITGLRREQAASRGSIRTVEIDHDHGGIAKLNPLARWTQDQVWSYLRQHDVPYSTLYDQGYTSIGCAPCTRAIEAGEDPRAGRWWWENPATKECGLHLAQPTNNPSNPS